MRISLINSPRPVATIDKPVNLVVRVISGDVLVAPDQQTLTDGGGLPIAITDGIVWFPWYPGKLYMQSATGTAVCEVIVP